MKSSTSPHTRAQTPCTFARAPPLATALGLGRGVTPPRSQCLLLGVATPQYHISGVSFLSLVASASLGQPLTTALQRLTPQALHFRLQGPARLQLVASL